ncbi:MAG: hypothetical protein M0Q43_06410 [Methanothrix sp.]|nr:hypothetical protein [Methanothrix sp.]
MIIFYFQIGLFVLAGAPCFESRRPCSIAPCSRPRAWSRLPGGCPETRSMCADEASGHPTAR